MKALNKVVKKTFVIMIFSTSLFAGGDNKVSMTDMKEALYNLVITADKTDKSIVALDDRISKIEPVIPSVERNTKNVASLINRLNELGIPTSSDQSQDISDEISRFVKQNRQYLPQGVQGVR